MKEILKELRIYAQENKVPIIKDEALAVLINECKEFAKVSGSKLTFTDDPLEGTKDDNVIYTDVWVSMGEPMELWDKRIKLLSPFQVNKKIMENANKNAIFLHCLPSFHDTNTTIGNDVYKKYDLKELEVSNEVFESKQSKVFDEAENRLHTIKAVMYATLK